MSFNYLVPAEFSVAQNTNIYIMDQEALPAADYTFDIPLSGTANNFFTTRTYFQNSANNNLYTLDLVMNSNHFNSKLNALAAPTAGPGKAVVGALTSANIDMRLLEIAALEIFGHAKARAAIANDNDFVNKLVGIHTTVFDVMNLQNTKNNFFEQYVDSGRVADLDDITEPQSFNLADTHIWVKGWLNGVVQDATPGSAGDVVPYNTSYNASILLDFNGAAAGGQPAVQLP
jgi:hypothetical protein